MYKKVLDIFWKHQLKAMDSRMQAIMMLTSPLEILIQAEITVPKSILYLSLK